MATRLHSTKDNKATVAKVAAKLGDSDMPVGDKIDRLFELREKKRLIQKEIDAIENDIGALKDLVIADLGGLKLEGSRGARASVSINKKIVVGEVDWEKAHAFIKKNDYQHLYMKRILDTGFRELLERLGEKKLKTQAGMTPFEKVDLNITSL